MSTSSIPEAFTIARRHFDEGRLPQALHICRQIVGLDPRHVGAWHLLGLIAMRSGQSDEALKCFDAVLKLAPAFADAHNMRGVILAGQRKPALAADSFREALRYRPDLVMARNNLGNALRELGDRGAALACFQEVVRLAPDSVAGQSNLGGLLLSLGRFAEAEVALQHAARLRPDSIEVSFNLGLVLARLGRTEESIAWNRQAIRRDPARAGAHANLGHGLAESGRVEEAIAAYRTALHIEPAAAQTHSALIQALHHHAGHDLRAIRDECRLWDARHGVPLRKEIRPHETTPDPDRRLRVGYVSPDFRGPATARCVVPLLSHHDLARFDIFYYADVGRPDDWTGRIPGLAESWRPIAGLDHRRVAELVRTDRIDILVDLKGHTAGNRLLAFALKPAPVQVSWLSDPGLAGLSAIDYRLTDPHVDPVGLADDWDGEKALPLPTTAWCYDPPSDQPDECSLPARNSGSITFGCLERLARLSDPCLRLWALVLRELPDSHLLLMAPAGPRRGEISTVFAEEGIDPGRIRFADRREHPESLSLYHEIDIALDALPYSGTASVFDATWMGVPTLTTPGNTPIGRGCWSHLCNLDLKELAAETPEQLVSIARGLAGDLPRLEEWRRSLRERMKRSPLMDADRFARDVEAAYRGIWRRWCEQPFRGQAAQRPARRQ